MSRRASQEGSFNGREWSFNSEADDGDYDDV